MALSASEVLTRLNKILFSGTKTGNYKRDPYHIKDYQVAVLLKQYIEDTGGGGGPVTTGDTINPFLLMGA